MRVLVTGGAGFIGSFLVDRLLRDGYGVRVLDSLDPQVHPHGAPSYLAPGAELLVGDVRDRRRCLQALEEVDAVVHAAAAVGVGQSLYRVEHYVDVNVRGTATLPRVPGRAPAAALEARGSDVDDPLRRGPHRRPSDGRRLRVGLRTEEGIRRHGWEPVCPETDEPLQPVPTPEDARPLARNVYALTKRWQEELVLALGAVYGIPVACLRLFNVYGPRQSLSNPYTGVIAIFLSRILAGQAPVVYEDGGQSRDFVSVHDVVEAMMAALDSPAADGEVINVGGGVARPVGLSPGRWPAWRGDRSWSRGSPGSSGRATCGRCVAALGRARELLGFEPRVGWEEGLREVVGLVPGRDRCRRVRPGRRGAAGAGTPLRGDPRRREPAVVKRIVVTGSSGLVGSEAVALFDARGWEVHGVDNDLRARFFGPDGDTSANLERLRRTTRRFTHHALDVRDRAGIDALWRAIRPDLVLHSAGQPSRDLARERPLEDFEINAVATLGLLEATRQHYREAAFVFMSTNKVYGDAPTRSTWWSCPPAGSTPRPPTARGSTTHCRVDASTHSVFGASKLAADVIVQEYGRCFDMATACLRAGCLTGGNHAGAELHGFLAYLARAVREGRVYRIYGYQGKQVRDNLHAHRRGHGLPGLPERPRRGAIYNLGGGRANSVSVLEAIARCGTTREAARRRVRYGAPGR